MAIELDPVDRITAGAVGEPGERTFFLQGKKGDHLVTLLVEKGQVQQLAAAVVEILARIGADPAAEADTTTMDLEPPLEPEWRAGRLAIGYEEDRDLLVLEVEELVPEEEDEDAGWHRRKRNPNPAWSGSGPRRTRCWRSPATARPCAPRGGRRASSAATPSTPTGICVPR